MAQVSGDAFINAMPLVTSLVSGGALISLLRWRPEATSSAVQASEDAVQLVRGELARLRDEVVYLRGQVDELRVQLRESEREVGKWRAKYEDERAAHHRTRNKLADLQRDNPEG